MIKFTLKTLLIWRGLLTFMLIFLSHLALANQLVASVDRDNISIQDTFTLTISADSKASGQPDFSPLKTDFDILSNNVSQYTSITNNGAEFKKVWQLTLAPKHTGTLLIPSFSVDGVISDAIQVTVAKKSSAQTSSDEKIRVSLNTDKNIVFTQEQILVTIKVISKVNLNQAEMQPLTIKDALVIPLDEKPNQYITTINGIQHLVLESKYAVFPQKSGDLTIPSVIYSVAPRAERDVWNDPFGQNSGKVVRLQTDEQHITVKPSPTLTADQSWQPAKNLTLNETWSASLDHLKMGEPVTRTITISADGLSGGQISPLPNPPVDGLTFYPDQPQNSDGKSEKGVQGTRVETMAIIPNKGGEFTLPEIKVDWWNTKTNTMQTAIIPAKKINVLGSSTPTTNNVVKNDSNKATTTEPQTTPVITTKANPWLWVSTITFALLAIAIAIYAFKLKSSLNRLLNEQVEANEIISEKEKHIWDLLKHAAANKDATALRKTILSWAHFQWPEASIHSLDDVAKLGAKPELTHALKGLDKSLYSSHPTDEWDPKELLRLLNDYRKERNMRKKNDGLKPLYNS